MGRQGRESRPGLSPSMVRDLWRVASICQRKHVRFVMHGALVMPVKAVARVVRLYLDIATAPPRRPGGPRAHSEALWRPE